MNFILKTLVRMFLYFAAYVVLNLEIKYKEYAHFPLFALVYVSCLFTECIVAKRYYNVKKVNIMEVLLAFMLSFIDFITIYLVYQMASRQSHMVFALFTITVACLCGLYDQEDNLLFFFAVLFLCSLVYSLDTYTTFGSSPIDDIFESVMVERKLNHAALALILILFRVFFVDSLAVRYDIPHLVYSLFFSIFAFISTANDFYKLTFTYTKIYIVLGAVLSGIMHATTNLCDFGSLRCILLVYLVTFVFIFLYVLDFNGYVFIKSPQELLYALPAVWILCFILFVVSIPLVYHCIAYFTT